MPPNKPQSNYSKRPIKKVRLLKIGPPKTKGLFEEYFYGFLVAIVVLSSILGKAGGLSGSDAVVMGLWLGGITWFAWQLKRYFKEKSKPAPRKKRVQVVEALPQRTNGPIPPGMKPMIGPQWPLKGAQGPAQVSQAPGQNSNKPAFVYERPTLPDRKPKFPANWPGQPSKKPKR
jgi:hypothetical protein